MDVQAKPDGRNPDQATNTRVALFDRGPDIHLPMAQSPPKLLRAQTHLQNRPSASHPGYRVGNAEGAVRWVLLWCLGKRSGETTDLVGVDAKEGTPRGSSRPPIVELGRTRWLSKAFSTHRSLFERGVDTQLSRTWTYFLRARI